MDGWMDSCRIKNGCVCVFVCLSVFVCVWLWMLIPVWEVAYDNDTLQLCEAGERWTFPRLHGQQGGHPVVYRDGKVQWCLCVFYVSLFGFQIKHIMIICFSVVFPTFTHLCKLFLCKRTGVIFIYFKSIKT